MTYSAREFGLGLDRPPLDSSGGLAGLGLAFMIDFMV